MNKQFSVGCFGTGKRKACPFRMPLYTQDGHFLMLDGFSNSIRGSLGDAETGARLPDALMMGTVDQAGRTVQAEKDASGLIEGCMELILFVPLMESAGGEVLD